MDRAMTLSEATEAYQAYLEGCRLHPEDEQLQAELLQAEQAMTLAWLNAIPKDPG